MDSAVSGFNIEFTRHCTVAWSDVIVSLDSALEIRDEVGFFQEIRAVLAKGISAGDRKSPKELDAVVRQIVSRAISSDKL